MAKSNIVNEILNYYGATVLLPYNKEVSAEIAYIFLL